MTFISYRHWQLRAGMGLTLLLVFVLASVFILSTRTHTSAASPISPSVSRIKLSTDPYTNATSQHKTQVEPDTFAFGSTIVSTFQSGRFPDSHGGSSNIGWATSTNGGSTWKHGFLSGITVFAGGTFQRATDPSVAYDAFHKVWLISSMGLIVNGSSEGAVILVSRSTNGGLTWSSPVVVSNQGSTTLLDKDWIVCDDTSTSSFYGHCYTEWDNNSAGNLIEMSTSTDGGKTWGSFKTTADAAAGLGGQPLVQPNGAVLVPIDDPSGANAVLAFDSIDGGASWSSTVVVQTIVSHTEAGGLRSGPLISAEMDAAGVAYIFWQDCRFVTNCAANQLVFVTLTVANKSIAKSALRRVPTPVSANAALPDYFIPGIAVDKTTSGNTAHLVLTYYYYTNTNCTFSTCSLNVGSISSVNGGSSWSPQVKLAGSMKLAWLPTSDLGRMVGDYISVSFSGSVAYPAFEVAAMPTNKTDCTISGAICQENTYSVVGGLTALGGSIPSSVGPVVVSSQPSVPTLRTAH